MIDFKILDYVSGKVLGEYVSNRNKAHKIGDVITLTIVNDKLYHQDAKFKVAWCSKVENNSQTVLVTYIPESGKMIHNPQILKEIIKTTSVLAEQLYNVQDNKHYKLIYEMNKSYQEDLTLSEKVFNILG